MADSFDLAIIGAGPAGYVCAIRAAQLGLSVAVIERRAELGGTCLNVGCIPSKALLSSSNKYESAARHFAAEGIELGTPGLDLKKMLGFKAKVVRDNTKGVEYLFRKNKITRYRGQGRLDGPGRVSVADSDGKESRVEATHIVLAPGSETTSLPGVEIDEKRILSSTGALDLKAVPDHLLVIGGGYIGLELGTVWRRLGAKVTVVEFLDRILPGMDSEIAAEAKKILGRQGLEFRLGAKVTGAEIAGAEIAGAEIAGDGVEVVVAPARGESEGKAGDEAAERSERLTADRVLVAIGRRPALDGLGLEAAGVALTESGRIAVDERWRTSLEGVYAIGDAIEGPMLAHKGEDEGVAVAERIAGKAGHVNYDVIPGIVYTEPEIAQVGLSEDELEARGTAYRVGRFPFTANGRARAMGHTDGFVKILADARTDTVLGAHIIGPEAGILIAEIAAIMEFGGAAEDIARTCHAHPTLSETVREAALAVDGRALHI